ncbi:resolvase [Cyanobium sp. NIES-981]|uniref:resolvase n=1 Tax=Cyanobium sp. NIES-981 TaxID=1851505 RepID=UPI0007DD5EA7|nr:resolvase [Cyanobium sp. NIES-981]SBO43664.1 conserved protein of unknown function [Cyanobium sp. NIES-981]
MTGHRGSPAGDPEQPPLLAGLDPGRSKCGLVLVDREAGQVLQAAILPPPQALALLAAWHEQRGLRQVVLGDGTGSRPWPQWLRRLTLEPLSVEERGTTLAARTRYWELRRRPSWRQLLPRGLRLPPRDIDDVVAQLLVERWLGRRFRRSADGVLRTWPVPPEA